MKPVESITYRVYVGLIACAVGTLLIGSVSLMAVRLLFAAAALSTVAIWAWRRWGGRDDGGEALPLPRYELDRIESLCFGTLVFANSLTLLSAMAPVTSWDATVAHLALPSDYARAGHIGFIEGNVYSAYPHFMHTLFSYVFYESGERSTALLSWLFGLLACLAVYDLGRRVMDRQTGLIAAAIFASSPIYFSQAGTVSIDVAFTGMTAAALACAFAWYDEKQIRWLVLAGVLAGSSCGIRHTGYLVCVLIAIGIIWVARQKRASAAGTFAGVSLIAALPWMIRSAVVVGNPVYPFFKNVFGANQLLDVQNPTLMTHYSTQGTGLIDVLIFPWTIIMRPDMYDGWTASPGPLLLLLGPPGLFLCGSRVRILGAFSIAGGACFFVFQRLARYLLPFFTPMMVVAACAAGRLDRWRRPITVLLAISFGYGLLLGAAMMHFKVPVVLGLESDVRYLENRVERFDAFQWVNRNLPKDATVMTFDPRSFYIDRPTYPNFEVLKVLREMPIEEQVDWLRERNIRYLFYPVAYMNESPGYAQGGYLQDVNKWRADTEHFELVHSMHMPRPDGSGEEVVEIYEVRGVGAGGAID